MCSGVEKHSNRKDKDSKLIWPQTVHLPRAQHKGTPQLTHNTRKEDTSQLRWKALEWQEALCLTPWDCKHAVSVRLRKPQCSRTQDQAANGPSSTSSTALLLGTRWDQGPSTGTRPGRGRTPTAGRHRATGYSPSLSQGRGHQNNRTSGQNREDYGRCDHRG